MHKFYFTLSADQDCVLVLRSCVEFYFPDIITIYCYWWCHTRITLSTCLAICSAHSSHQILYFVCSKWERIWFIELLIVYGTTTSNACTWIPHIGAVIIKFMGRIFLTYAKSSQQTLKHHHLDSCAERDFIRRPLNELPYYAPRKS